MGASGVGLFDDGVAADVRSEYLDLLANGVSDAEAFKTLVREWKEPIADSDDGPVFWLALAATQWEYGRLHLRAKAQALKVIDQEKGIDRWVDAGLDMKRRAVLARLKKKLLSPEPERRTPRQRPVVESPSFSVAAPDGKSEATAWFIGVGSGQPKSQVYITMKVKGDEGGGGVFVGYCQLADIKLKWLDATTLRISYPKDAQVEQQKSTCFYCGRTVAVRYRRV
jgi:hypothetical protein